MDILTNPHNNPVTYKNAGFTDEKTEDQRIQIPYPSSPMIYLA